jgi:hypothetical protein
MRSGSFAFYPGSIIYLKISLAAFNLLILIFFFTVVISHEAEKPYSMAAEAAAGTTINIAMPGVAAVISI